MTAQLSVGVGSNQRTTVQFNPGVTESGTMTLKLDGQPSITGGIESLSQGLTRTMLTLNEQVAVFPAESRAMYLTMVFPTGKQVSGFALAVMLGGAQRS